MTDPGGDILITGASGSLGKQLVYELDRQGLSPVAQVRQSSDTRYLDSVGVRKRVTDLRNKTDLSRLVAGVDSIIHTAAWVNFRQDRLADFVALNTDGSRHLFAAAQKAGVKRFVHVSTVAAVGAIPRQSHGELNPVGPPDRASEDTPFNLGHLHIPYIMTKREAEEKLLQSAPDGKTELVIVNPSVIVAPSRTGDDRGKALKKFPRWLAPGLPNFVNLVDIRDVAAGVIAAMNNGRPGERYILGGDNVTARELLLIISSVLGRAPHFVRLPRAALFSAARLAALRGRLTGSGKVSFYPDLIRLLDYDWAFSSRKARRELGYTSRSLYVTLKDLLTNNFTHSYAR
ncbi:MAG: NAD-dependent epimerase/dehydratase family protein [bacterium]